MADSEILRFLQENPTSGLEIVLREDIHTISQEGAKSASYWLQYASNTPEFTKELFLDVVGPEMMGNGSLAHPEYNLQMLTADIKARLPVSQQLKLMKKALEAIAKVDPRIRGDNVEPVAQITRVGGREYDLGLMRAFYAYVQHEFHERGLDNQKL